MAAVPPYLMGVLTGVWDSNSLLARIAMTTQVFDNSVAVGWVAVLAGAFDSELEEFPELRAFCVGRKVWRREWDSNPR